MADMSAQIVPATAAMIRSLHAELPKTVRAVAAVEGDRVLGVAGIYPQEGYLILFGAIAPDTRAELHRHKRALLRCVWKVLGFAMQRRMPVFAVADEDIEGSDRFLRHLGFIPREGGYEWHGSR